MALSDWTDGLQQIGPEQRDRQPGALGRRPEPVHRAIRQPGLLVRLQQREAQSEHPGPAFPVLELRLSGRSSGQLPRIAKRLGCWRTASTASALALGSHPGGWITAAVTPASSISLSASSAL